MNSGFSGSGSTTTLFSTSLAVVVLIHGESYSWGAGHLMDGGMLAAKSRMVVVTLNYRLGILGICKLSSSSSCSCAAGLVVHLIISHWRIT
jgi:carboxylesterase type B